jgi:hypothetical protein
MTIKTEKQIILLIVGRGGIKYVTYWTSIKKEDFRIPGYSTISISSSKYPAPANLSTIKST